MSDTVTLRNGYTHHKGLVAVMHLTCDTMMTKQPTAMFDAVSIARDSSYQPFGDNGKILQDAVLLESSGKMSSTVREILCAFFEGEMLEMTLLGPSGYLKG